MIVCALAYLVPPAVFAEDFPTYCSCPGKGEWYAEKKPTHEQTKAIATLKEMLSEISLSSALTETKLNKTMLKRKMAAE